MKTEIVKSIDITRWKELELRMLAAAKKQVVVGVPASKNPRKEGALSSAMIAAVHEFGSPERGIPQRSFIRSAMYMNQDKYKAYSEQQLKRVIRGEADISQSMARLGEIATGDIKKNIAEGSFEALSEATVKRKGSSKPLIDTGQLRQSIAYEVRDV